MGDLDDAGIDQQRVGSRGSSTDKCRPRIEEGVRALEREGASPRLFLENGQASVQEDNIKSTVQFPVDGWVLEMLRPRCGLAATTGETAQSAGALP
jgi:hypothetical protein